MNSTGIQTDLSPSQAASLREIPLSREEIFDGHILHVERWTVRCPNGDEAPREIVLHRGAAAVIPLFADGKIFDLKALRLQLF